MRSSRRLRASVPARLGVFACLLALALGAGAALGAAVDPGGPAAECAPMSGMGHEAFGLSLAQGDTAISPATFSAAARQKGRLRFRILGSDGAALRSGFELEAERRMHLLLVRRDLTGYQHLHPAMAGDGTWSVPLTVPEPGAYRVYADFQRSCEKHVLAADLLVPGAFEPQPLPAASATTRVDGYDVRLAAPALHAGDDAHLRFTVTRDGRPLRDIQPYLGARGHLVAIRQGDLAYLHVHPDEEGDDGAAIPFSADFASAGSYRLFLQFRSGGTLHTAAFTVEVAA